MSELSENKSDLDKVNELIKEIENGISTINNLLKEKLSDYRHYIEKNLFIKENIGKMNDFQHMLMLKQLKDKVVAINELISSFNVEDSVDNIQYNINILSISIDSAFNLFYSYYIIFIKTQNEISYHLTFAKRKAEEKIGEIDELKNILKDKETYKMYKNAEDTNIKEYNFYICFAIGFGVIGLLFSIFSKIIFTQCFLGKLCILEYNNIDYWTMKASIIFITITGITFCLKQAIHHQKKKDKAEQTRLELEALPTYMFNFSDEQKNKVYAELTSKYFGRDFNNEGYQDMSNIIQEQIKLSHEVLKTTIANQKNGNQP